MSGLAFGLGGFVSGFQSGFGLRQQQEDRALAKEDRAMAIEDRATDRAWAEEDRAYQRSQRARQTADEARAEENRASLEDIRTEAAQDFEEAVASGEYKADQFDDFFTKHTVPMLVQERLLQGDTEGADALQTWGETKEAKEGARLFGTALVQSLNGDNLGALTTAYKAWEVNGYLDDDLDVSAPVERKRDDGSIFYEVTFTQPNGDQVVNEIEAADVPMAISYSLNPAAAAESQMALLANSSKRNQERADKREDADYAAGIEERAADVKLRADIAKQLGEADTEFFSLPPEDQQARIDEQFNVQKGNSLPAQPQTIVDRETGQVLNPTPGPAAAGLGAVPTPGGASSPGLGAVPKPPAQAGMGPRDRDYSTTSAPNTSPSAGMGPRPRDVTPVDKAAQMLIEGQDPQAVAQMLTSAGVAQSEWPTELVRQNQTGAQPSGLGR